MGLSCTDSLKGIDVGVEGVLPGRIHRPAEQQLREDKPQCEQVGTMVDCVPNCLFRGHVQGRAPQAVGPLGRKIGVVDPGKAPIQQPHVSLRGQDHIVWLEVPVHQLERLSVVPWGRVGLVQGVGQFAAHLNCRLCEDLGLALFELLEDGPKRRAMHVLHDHSGLSRQVLKDTNNPPVLDLIEKFELLLKRVRAQPSRSILPKLLDGHDAPPRTLRAPRRHVAHCEQDGAEAPRPQLRKDLVLANESCQERISGVCVVILRLPNTQSKNGRPRSAAYSGAPPRRLRPESARRVLNTAAPRYPRAIKRPSTGVRTTMVWA